MRDTFNRSKETTVFIKRIARLPISGKIIVMFSVCFLVCSLTACQHPSSPGTNAAGSITGKVVFQNASDNSGITVSLEQMEGARSLTVISAVRGLDTARILSRHTATDKDGMYTFEKVAPGTYAIYASTKDLQKQAVAINVKVEAGRTVTAPDLNLTPVGKISGTITLDGAKPDVASFLVCVAGTSYMAATDADGNFVINNVPAGDNYLIIITKGNYTDVWSNAAVTVTGGETTILTPPVLDISSAAANRDSTVPHIGENGNWWIGETDTGVPATGPKGDDGNTPVMTIGENGNWYINGIDTNIPATGPEGDDGTMPIITVGDNGNWHIDDVDTGVPAQGPQGDDGNMQVITVGDNGNWHINGIDTNIPATGPKGDTPVITIGSNGNWHINGADTGVPAQGPQGPPGITRLIFSHNSGLYSEPFNLILKAPMGSEIYYSIDGSVPLPEKVDGERVFKYVSPIVVQDRNGQPNLLATAANVTQMYMAPGDPRGSVLPYYPTDDQVPKATVIRAITVDLHGKQSNAVTKTYFVGDNLVNYGDNRIISLVTDPYNLIDEDYGIYVRGPADKRWPNYNFNMKGSDWERETSLELFDSSRNVALSTGVGIRIRGGGTRGWGQKSFNVYFREEYGINNLKNYNLIPGAVTSGGMPVATYKGFMLRNGERHKFGDVFIQDLVSDRSFTTQAAVPCVVYLNGEYWGFYNLQERYSDNHTEYKYGVKKENVISYDNGELDDGTEADVPLWNVLWDFRSKDMSIQTNYDEFCECMDIDSYIDYFATELYISNIDWPQNNYRLWRVRTPEPGNPYGDGKWRWQMHDTDAGFGSIVTDEPFNRILNGPNNTHRNNQLFKALLANNDFCQQFVNTIMDLYNVNFHPDSSIAKLNKIVDIYRPLIADYDKRFSNCNFEDKVTTARNYLNNIRNAMTNNYLPTYFGGYTGIYDLGITASDLYNVTISTSVSGASVKINTVTPSLVSGSWTGKYYSAIPVTITASAPPPGYEFDGWTVTGGTATSPSALTTTINFTGDVQITANYK